jgi:beta-lactamase class A
MASPAGRRRSGLPVDPLVVLILILIAVAALLARGGLFQGEAARTEVFPPDPLAAAPSAQPATPTEVVPSGEDADPALTALALATVGTPLPTPGSVGHFTPFTPPGFNSDLDLATKVSQRIVGRPGRYGVAIKDLETGRGVLIDPDGEYQAASLFKLWVMFEVFKQRERGTLDFDERLVLTDRHVEYDLGTLDRPAGSILEISEAVDRMITISDNSAAILLSDRVGATNINADLRALGMQHSRFLLDDLVTSPGDVLKLLDLLASGQAVSPNASAQMVHLLARQRVNDRLPRLLPAGSVVAHKTGNLDGVVNDAGIIYAPGASFIAAVLVDGASDEAEAARVIADLAVVAYDHFRALTPAGPSRRVPPVPPTATLVPTRPTEPPATPLPPRRTVALETPSPTPTADATSATPQPGGSITPNGTIVPGATGTANGAAAAPTATSTGPAGTPTLGAPVGPPSPTPVVATPLRAVPGTIPTDVPTPGL